MHLVRRSSSAWSVAQALTVRGLEAPDEAMVFGLGSSAWYALVGPAGDRSLLAFHPASVKNSFYALNVDAVELNYLCDNVLHELRARAHKRVMTIITVNGCALLPEPHDSQAAHAYTILVHWDLECDSSRFLIQGVLDPAPRPVSAEELMRAWYLPARAYPTATLYWHPVLTLNWTQAPAIRRALQRYLNQMQSGRQGEVTGMAALQQLCSMEQAERTAMLQRLGRVAHLENNLALGRDLMAEFVRCASRVLQEPRLANAAEYFEASGQAWQELLQREDDTAAQFRDAIDLIIRCETAALDAIEHSLRPEAACLG